MIVHSEFEDFNRKVRLSQSKRNKLKTHRKTLRKRITDYFKEKKWDTPKYASQGSFPLQTNINPIKTEDEDGNELEEYDLDDGVYFICPEEKRESAKTYHDRVFEAVDGHAKDAAKKPSCVRVIYSDGHHVDLPIYWLSEEDETPEIARANQGYTLSDPKEFKDWVEDQIEATDNTGQLRRIIRHLKAWRDYQQTEDSTLKLPPGVTLTILACENYQESDNDDESFRETLRAIKDTLDEDFTCNRPTTPSDEDLLKNFSKKRVVAAFKRAVEAADKADEAETKTAACEQWRSILGERFPKGEDSSTKSASEEARATNFSYLPSPYEKRFEVSWRESLRWPEQHTHQVSLFGFSKISEHSLSRTQIQNDGPALAKHLYLQFEAQTDAPGMYHVFWQVVNTGRDAINAGSLRGRIIGATHSGEAGLNSNKARQLGRSERTLYTGMHWVECFIVQNSVCIARSGPFVINIQ